MVVLHIGTDKTGSTAIQKLMSDNKSLLEKKRWEYPTKFCNLEHKYIPKYNHAGLIISFRKNEFAILEELKNEIEESGLENILLSFEYFYRLNEEQILAFVSALKSLNRGEVKIIIYLRRQDDKLESNILQRMKGGKIKKLKLKPHTYKAREELDYYSIIEKWNKFIKKENIIIRPYGKQFLPHQDSLYEDFFQSALSLDFNEMKEDLCFPDKDPNPSLDAVSGCVVDFLVNDETRDTFISQLLVVQNRYGTSKAHLFNKEERKKILSLYKKGNDKMIEAYHIPKALFEPEEKDYNQPTKAEIGERLSHLYERKAYLCPLTSWGGKAELKPNIKRNKIALLEGFYRVEEIGVWTKGNEISKLSFLLFRHFYYLYKYLDVVIKSKYLRHSDTRSFLKIGDNGWMELSGNDHYRLPTEEVSRDGGVVFVEFKHTNAVSPEELGSSGDTRVLGCRIDAINFEAIV